MNSAGLLYDLYQSLLNGQLTGLIEWLAFLVFASLVKKMELIDTHAHVYLEEFQKDRTQIINDAQSVGINKVLLPNIDLGSVESLKQLAKDYPDYYIPMMGLHPCYVGADYKEQLSKIKLELDQGNYCAVGEIGVDLYWDKSQQRQQVEAFKTQIEWAKEKRLPVAIHARNSFDEIFEVLDEVNSEVLTGVLHCFTGDVDQAERIIAYGGFKLGVGGVVTFKNAGLDKVMKQIDLKHLILETDSPYLSPHPKRGKRNEPSRLKYIAYKLAEIKNTTIEEISAITTKNAKDLFKI